MTKLKFIAPFPKLTSKGTFISITGILEDPHPNFKEGTKIRTSHVVFFDEYVNMIKTVSGTIYYLQADFDNDIQYKLFRSLARKNKISNLP